MRILVADRDPSLGRLLGDMLEAEGYTARCVSDGVSALSLVRAESWNFLLLDVQLPLRNGLELLRMVRALNQTVPAFLTTDRIDPKIRAAADLLKAERLLTRPFDAFALLDHIQVLRGKARQEELPVIPGGAAENLLLLGRLWSTRASGTLRLEPEGSAAMAAGGPVGAEGLSLVQQAMRGGRLWFSPGIVESSGNRSLFTDLLYRAAIDHRLTLGDDRILRYDPMLLTDLPLPSALKTALLQSNGRASVIGLKQRCTAPEEAEAALGALAAVGLVSPEEVRAAPPARRSIGPESRSGSFSGRPYSGIQSDSVNRSSLHLSQRSEHLSERPFSAERPPPPSPPQHEVTFRRSDHSDPAPRSNPRSNPGTLEDARTDPLQGRGRASVAATLRAHALPTAEQQRAFLERELLHLRDAGPWAVLAVEANAPLERIHVALERMSNRYQALTGESDPEVSRLAGQLLARVNEAGKAAIAERMSPLEKEEAPEPIGTEDDEMFRKGMVYAKKAQWAHAEHWFSRARDLAAGSSRNLGWLGWATANNPDRHGEKRLEEGISLLRLAEQFDPENVEAAYHLAVLLSAQEPEAAMRRLARVLKLRPGHSEAHGLLRKLRSRVEKNG